MQDECGYPRWTAIAYYHSQDGVIDVEHKFEELEELHDIIEQGPDWYALDRIEIRLADLSRRVTID